MFIRGSMQRVYRRGTWGVVEGREWSGRYYREDYDKQTKATTRVNPSEHKSTSPFVRIREIGTFESLSSSSQTSSVRR